MPKAKASRKITVPHKSLPRAQVDALLNSLKAGSPVDVFDMAANPRPPHSHTAHTAPHTALLSLTQPVCWCVAQRAGRSAA